MAVMSAKNMALSPAASDLGFGGFTLEEQLKMQEDERKKKLMLGNNPADYGDNVLGPATQALYGGFNRG